MKQGRPKKTYVLYKGDDQIAEGTIYEIAEELGRPPKSIQYYGTPSYKKKNPKRKYEKTYFLMEVVDED